MHQRLVRRLGSQSPLVQPLQMLNYTWWECRIELVGASDGHVPIFPNSLI